ncbi:hypothetical protein P4M26_31480 [Pseudomonas aeruginosa]|nr:hypothetical protein [Pseudomonas aeruginosa]MDF5884580.1 hypothetical protein [Pseudomonas aeruginosa]MDF5993208.1 hypothetical protein [Pseudomonas aeruginosa]MDF5996143.1 hypothetical protein [Pseudomonas aeruginosa]
MEIAQFADLVSVAKVQPEQRRLRVYKAAPTSSFKDSRTSLVFR